MIKLGSTSINEIKLGNTNINRVYQGNNLVFQYLPESLRSNLVLWYDLSLQGATNQSMAADPRLLDLSGNGHHATCQGFAWKGMSGVGGYYFQTLHSNAFANKYVVEHNSDCSVVTFKERKSFTGAWMASLLKSVSIGDNVHYKIEVSGLSKLRQSFPDTYLTDGGNNNQTKYYEDGVYENQYTATNIYATMSLYNVFNDAPADLSLDVTIRQIPLYPHALVSDGVDDYALTDDIPAFSRETGFTVMAMRENTDPGNTNGSYGIAKYTSNWSDAAFLFDENPYVEGGTRVTAFGSGENVSTLDWENCTFIAMTPNKVMAGNESLAIHPESVADSMRPVSLFRYKDGAACRKSALYSLLLFDRSLSDDEIAWVKENMVESKEEEVDWYGVEFYTTSPYPDCIRIGNPELHKTLPVHTQMKGCLLADDGTVNKYLDESDWTSETRDGSQGQVMVEMPKLSYWKFETDGNIRRIKFSTKPLDGFTLTPQGYVSAYEASLQRSTNTLCSVVNTDADYRGGNNNTEWDDTYRSQLGMPATGISLNNLRIYARNRKAGSSEWNIMTYDMQKLLYWLFVVEYATLNSQAAYNAQLTEEGFHQGGLGSGVTTLNGTKWSNFNGYYPFVPCGTTNSLGNKTGYVEFTMPFEYDASGEANYKGEYSAATAYTAGQYVSQGELLYTCKANAEAGTALTNTTYFTPVTRTVVQVPSYRGVENPFGHIWKWTDGCKCLIQSEADGGLSEFYVCDDPAAFTSSGTLNYELRGNLPRKNGYVKKLILGEDGEIMPLEVGAGSTTYFCDYFYTNIPASGVSERGVLFGDCADYGASAGFVFARTDIAAMHSYANFGSRLCFIPNN